METVRYALDSEDQDLGKFSDFSGVADRHL